MPSLFSVETFGGTAISLPLPGLPRLAACFHLRDLRFVVSFESCKCVLRSLRRWADSSGVGRVSTSDNGSSVNFLGCRKARAGVEIKRSFLGGRRSRTALGEP